MSLPKIDIAIKDDEGTITKLNQLITDYNQKPTGKRLQQIIFFVEQIYENYLQYPGDLSNSFMEWYLRNPITQELIEFTKENSLNSNKFIIQAKAKTITKIETIKQWDMYNTYNPLTKNALSKLDQRLKDIIQTIYAKFSLAKSTYESSNKDENQLAFYLKSLEETQKEIITFLNNNISIKFNLIRNMFEDLQMRLNADIDGLIMQNKLTSKDIYQRQNTETNELNEIVHKESIDTLVNKLNDKSDFSLGKFDCHLLGGKNNKNWLAKDTSNGQFKVIRLERESRPTNYILIEKDTKDNSVNKFLAKDSFFYPTGSINNNGKMTKYNIAVSEFCKAGDLLSYRCNDDNFPKESDDKHNSIINKMLDITSQVANFALCLNKINQAYTDIKAENFLLRDNGEVITVDKKSLVTQDTNQIILHGNNSIPSSFRTPEHKLEARCEAEAFMIYEIGVMLYVLMDGDKINFPHGTASYTRDGQIIEFDFKNPIFQNEKGKSVEELIHKAIALNPNERIRLSEFIEECQRINGTEFAAADLLSY